MAIRLFAKDLHERDSWLRLLGPLLRRQRRRPMSREAMGAADSPPPHGSPSKHPRERSSSKSPPSRGANGGGGGGSGSGLSWDEVRSAAKRKGGGGGGGVGGGKLSQPSSGGSRSSDEKRLTPRTNAAAAGKGGGTSKAQPEPVPLTPEEILQSEHHCLIGGKRVEVKALLPDFTARRPRTGSAPDLLWVGGRDPPTHGPVAAEADAPSWLDTGYVAREVARLEGAPEPEPEAAAGWPQSTAAAAVAMEQMAAGMTAGLREELAETAAAAAVAAAAGQLLMHRTGATGRRPSLPDWHASTFRRRPANISTDARIVVCRRVEPPLFSSCARVLRSREHVSWTESRSL